MSLRSCRVTIQDMDGVSHTVEVTATTLYEAVAQGLAAIRGSEWVAGIAQGLDVVKVSVANVRVEHEVEANGLCKVVGQSGRIAQVNITQRGLQLEEEAIARISDAPSDQVLAQSPAANASGVSVPKMSILVAAPAAIPDR